MVLVPPLKNPNTDTFHLTAWSLWFKGLFSQLIAPSCAQFLYRQKDKRDGDKHTPLLWIRGTVLFLFPRHQPVETWASVLQLSTYQLAFTWKAFKIYTSTQTHTHTHGVRYFWFWWQLQKYWKKKMSSKSCFLLQQRLFVSSPVHLGQGEQIVPLLFSSIFYVFEG